MINTIWMLTDFTIENGCTRVVPMSHRSGVFPPPFFNLSLTFHYLSSTFHCLSTASP